MPTLTDLVMPFVEAFVMIVALVCFVRLNGLRSFSKMANHDFAVTVAMGSILASVVVSGTTGLGLGLSGLAALFVVQAFLARLRTHLRPAAAAMDNAPLLLMRDGEILEDNLAHAKVTRSDLIAKLREANVLQMSEVRAVVFEQTGDVSVLHGDKAVDGVLLEGVRDHP